MKNLQEKRIRKILVSVTGASGMIFLHSFLKTIQPLGIVIHGICSESGRQVLQTETDSVPEDLEAISHWFDIGDMGSAPASGSADYDAMIVLPCTMGSLAAIAGGLSTNLIHRAADVILKERKKLVLAVRETPLNRTHLKNMLSAHDAGAVICPVMPSYYLRPKSLEEAAESYSWRLADQLDLEIEGRKRWKC